MAEAASVQHSAFIRFSSLWLGQDAHQRGRATQSLLALWAYVAFAGVQQCEVEMGLIDAGLTNALSLFNLAGALTFFALIRSGLNLRLGTDPSLAVLQLVWGLLAMSGAYAIAGPARGAVMSLVLLITVSGVWALRARQARSLVLLAIGLLGVVMLWKSRTDALNYPPEVEAVHYLLVVMCLGGIWVLAERVSKLRSRLQARMTELERAQAQIHRLASRNELTARINHRPAGSPQAADHTRAGHHGVVAD